MILREKEVTQSDEEQIISQLSRKYRIRYFILMLILSPMTIELFTGSTPPLLYFNPFTLLIFTVVYGMSFILIREIKIRWNLTWQYMFLFPLIGIFIEGIYMQSFFNTGHIDLDKLSGLGMFFGIQWPWAIYLTIIHGLYSVTIPLFIIDFIFPSYKNLTVLSPKTASLFGVMIGIITSIQFLIITFKAQEMYVNYSINVLGTIFLVGVSMLLIYLAYLTKSINLAKVSFKNKWYDHFRTFFFLTTLLFSTYLFVDRSSYIIIFLQLLHTFCMIWFSIKYIYKTSRTTADFLPLFNGLILYSSIIAVFQGIGFLPNPDSPAGMQFVGMSFLVLAIWMNSIGYRRQHKKKLKIEE